MDRRHISSSPGAASHGQATVSVTAALGAASSRQSCRASAAQAPRTGRRRRSRGSWCSTSYSKSLHWLRSADEVGAGGDRDGVRRRVSDRAAVSRAHRSRARRAGAARVREARAQSWAARDADQGARRSPTSPSRMPKPSSARRRRPGARITRSAATPTISPSRSRRSSMRSSCASNDSSG